MKILVTGAKGQLGHDVTEELKKRQHEVIETDIDNMDITDLASVNDAFSRSKPDAVIHCAAWTAVDAAEEENNREKVFAVNEKGTANLASVCDRQQIKMLYLSTDYVFDGQGTTPWKPDCKDFSPLNVYGQSKLAGEQAVARLSRFFIVRIAWVFGKYGTNFIKTMLNAGKMLPDSAELFERYLSEALDQKKQGAPISDFVGEGGSGAALQESLSAIGGSLLKALFGDNPPVKVDVRMRGAHFLCPYCQRIYSGKVAYVQDDTGAIFRHTIAPDRCPSCNTVVDNEASGVRVRSKGIQRYVDKIWADGCPRCGGEVERIDMDWS